MSTEKEVDEDEAQVNTEWANDRVPKTWRSVVVWPAEIVVGSIAGKNESSDVHNSEEAAACVCSLLRREGFGGNGSVFPLSTRVEPIWD